MGVQFKLAQKKDLNDIIDLTNECFQKETPLSLAEKTFLQTEKDPNHLHLLVKDEENEETLAYCQITIIPSPAAPKETQALLSYLCVKPARRREHLATRLLEESARLASEHGAHKLLLWSKNADSPATALYQNTGFAALDSTIFEKEIA